MKVTRVCLTGGLGNQLFQLAAGLYVAENDFLHLFSNLSYPRSRVKGVPDIADFNLPPNVRILPTPIRYDPPTLNMRVGNTILKYGSIPPKFGDSWLGWKLLETAASVGISLSHKEFTRVFGSKNVGFDRRLTKDQKSSLLIGYFQTWMYFSDPIVRSLMLEMEPRSIDDWTRYHLCRAEEESPIVCHVRLGDYVHDKRFGNLTSAYYAGAIKKVRNAGHSGRLWIFSDEPEKAIEFLPKNEAAAARIVQPPEGDFSPVSVLTVMRRGLAYIVSNSTFGWWGATLSIADHPLVVAPHPWLLSTPTVIEITQPTWSLMDRNGFEINDDVETRLGR